MSTLVEDEQARLRHYDDLFRKLARKSRSPVRFSPDVESGGTGEVTIRGRVIGRSTTTYDAMGIAHTIRGAACIVQTQTGEMRIVPEEKLGIDVHYSSITIDAIRPLLEKPLYEEILRVIGHDRTARRAKLYQGDIFVAVPDGMPPEAMGS